MKVEMTQLREALEASWDDKTSYKGVNTKGNAPLGQCYSTSRVLQLFFPKAEIVEGEVWTGETVEKHFWVILECDECRCHLDFTWQQFPESSIVKSWKIRDRENLNDGEETIRRVSILHERVVEYLSRLNQISETQ